MSWADLQTQPPKEDAEQKAIRQELLRALDQSPRLTKYLNRVVKSGTYAQGRSLDNVAFAEGQRALARTLLQLGGQFDE